MKTGQSTSELWDTFKQPDTCTIDGIELGGGGGGRWQKKKIWKNPGYFPNLVKATKPGNPINVKQKKCEEKHPQN